MTNTANAFQECQQHREYLERTDPDKACTLCGVAKWNHSPAGCGSHDYR